MSEDEVEEDEAPAAGPGGKREPIYNVELMHERLEDIGWTDTEAWEETQVITGDDSTQVEDVDDDIGRELAFYNQVRFRATKRGPVTLITLCMVTDPCMHVKHCLCR